MLIESENESLIQLTHILNVIQERVDLFEIRLTEAKRALKAYYRLNIIPEGHTLFVLLDAVFNYSINSSANKALDAYINTHSKNQTLMQEMTEKKLIDEIIKQFEYAIKKIEFFPNQTRTGLIFLVNCVFTLDENILRNLIKNYIRKNSLKLIKLVCKQVDIQDKLYVKQLNEKITTFVEKDLL